MTTAYTSLLGLALPVTGELSGTWGDTVNTAITSLLDTAVAGTTSITTDADITLTTTTGASNQARQAILLWNPASGTTTRYITAPAQSKLYTVINASGGTQSIVIRGVGPTTGVTIAKGESAMVAWNGSDFVKVSSSGGALTLTDLTVTGNTILGDAAADTLTVNATSTFAAPVNFQGLVKLPSTGRSAAAALTVTAPAFLYGVASTYTDTTSSGTIGAMAPFYSIAQPTLSTSNVTTYTNAATLYIANAPAAGGSATITNPYALYVASGASYFGGAVIYAGGINFNGNVTVGDSSADTLTINSTITSNLIFTDNTYDIGASGATRPRNLYLAGAANTGTLYVGKSFGGRNLGNTVEFNGGAGTLLWYPQLSASNYNVLVQNDDNALIGGPNNAYGMVVGKHDGAAIRFANGSGAMDFAVNNAKTASFVYSASGPNGLQFINDAAVGGVTKYIFGSASGGAVALYANSASAGARGLRLGNFDNTLSTFYSQVDINPDYNAVSIGALAGANSTGLTLSYDSTTLASKNFFTINNRGTGTTQTGSYTIGGILWGAYRDVRNPANVAGIWAVRDNASSGLSSTGYLVFGAGGGDNINQDGVLPTIQMYVEPGGVGIGARAYNSNSLTLAGSIVTGHNATTTGDYISSGGGNNSTYNGIAIMSNALALNAQANTGLPTWIVDIGGRAADGTTFPVATQNQFRVAYRSAGGALYGSSDYLTINALGQVGVNTGAQSNYGITLRGNSHQFRVETGSDPTGYYAFFRSNYNYGQSFDIGVKGGGVSERTIMAWGDSAGLTLSAGGSNPITLQTQGTTRLQIASGGNVQITSNQLVDSNNEYWTFRNFSAYANAYWAYDQKVYNRYLGTSGDPSYAYVLLCEAYQGGATQNKTAYTGFVYWVRGSTGAGNFSFGAYVMVSAGYNNNAYGGKAVGNGNVDICQVTYSSVKYLAARISYTSSADVYVSGFSSSAIAPTLVSDGSVSSVSVLLTLAA